MIIDFREYDLSKLDVNFGYNQTNPHVQTRYWTSLIVQLRNLHTKENNRDTFFEWLFTTYQMKLIFNKNNLISGIEIPDEQLTFLTLKYL